MVYKILTPRTNKCSGKCREIYQGWFTNVYFEKRWLNESFSVL